MIRVKSIYAKIADDDGLRVLVDPVWPPRAPHGRGLSPVWLRDLAPSPGLLDLWSGNTIPWDGFVARYHEELGMNREYFGDLQDHGRNGGLTLLYGSRDPDHNAAVALKMLLEHNGPAAGAAGTGRAE